MKQEKNIEVNRTESKSSVYRLVVVYACVGMFLIFCGGCQFIFGTSADEKEHKSTDSCSVTYKIGGEDAEYVTYERIDVKSFKISFHSTPEYSDADYIITTNNRGMAYPTLMWTYLTGEKRQIFLRNHDAGAFWVDTIVSHHYEFLINHDLLRNDTVKTLDDIHRAQEWSAALWEQPYKYRAYTKEFNTIGYWDPSAKTYLDHKDAEVVR